MKLLHKQFEENYMYDNVNILLINSITTNYLYKKTRHTHEQNR